MSAPCFDCCACSICTCSLVNAEFQSNIIPSPIGFQLKALRKLYFAKLAAMGYGVLAIDTDSAFFANPYKMLKAPEMRNFSIVVQSEGRCPRLNGGMLYAQNACEGSSAQWFLRGIPERLFWVIRNPHRLNEYYPGLYSSNMPLERKRQRITMCTGEQDTVIDLAASAALDDELFVYTLRASVPKSDRDRWWNEVHPRLHCPRRMPVPPSEGICDHLVGPGLEMDLKRGRTDPRFRGEKLLSSPSYILGGVYGLAGYIPTCKPSAPVGNTRFQPPKKGPSAVSHFVGMAHHSREIAMRALGTWNYEVFENLIEPSRQTGVPEHQRPVLAIARPTMLGITSSQELHLLLSRLYGIARALGRFPAVPELKLKSNEGMAPMQRFIEVPDSDGSSVFVWLAVGPGTPGECTLKEYIFPPDLERIETLNASAVAKEALAMPKFEQSSSSSTSFDTETWSALMGITERSVNITLLRQSIANAASPQVVYLQADHAQGAEAVPRYMSGLSERDTEFLKKQECHFKPRQHA